VGLPSIFTSPIAIAAASVNDNPAIFGVGYGWSFSFKSFLIDRTGTDTNLLRLHIGSAGVIDYYTNTPQYFDGSTLTTVVGGYQLQHSDGSVDSYLQSYTNHSGQMEYFLTSRSDPAGNSLSFFYSISTNNSIRLLRVTDPDLRSTTFDYGNTNAGCTNLITAVNGPFGSATLVYDETGFLTNIIDAISITNQLDYIGGRIAALTTPYGTTTFVFGGRDDQSTSFFPDTNAANRYVEVTLPTGGKHLYLYREQGADVPSGIMLPNTSPLVNTFDSVADKDQRDSFHWGPLQFPHLSTNNYDFLTNTDYAIATQRHWLMQTNNYVWNPLVRTRTKPGLWHKPRRDHLVRLRWQTRHE
jgi:hypothetical protein